jgi:hypothetical protein
MQVLEFVFQDFVHWLGTLLIVGAVARGLGNVIRK